MYTAKLPVFRDAVACEVEERCCGIPTISESSNLGEAAHDNLPGRQEERRGRFPDSPAHASSTREWGTGVEGTNTRNKEHDGVYWWHLYCCWLFC